MSENEKLSNELKSKPNQLTHGQVIKGKNWMEFKGVKYDVDTWYDELAWEECLFIQNRLMHRIWFFNKSDYDCPSCSSHVDVHFQIQSTGVVLKCEYCKVSTLAVPFDITDNGEQQGEIAELVLSEEISIPKCQEIMLRTGQDSEWILKYIQRPRPRARHVHNSEEEKELEKGGD